MTDRESLFRYVGLAALFVVLAFASAGCGGDGYGSYNHDEMECKMAAHGVEIEVLSWRQKGVDNVAHAATFARVCEAAKEIVNG